MKYLIAALALISFAASAQTARTATIGFTRPAAYTDGTPIAAGTAVSYEVFQAVKGQPKVKVATITGTATTINTGLAAGSEYCWQVTAVVNGVSSAQSNEACKAFAFPTPDAVTITVT